MTGTASLGKGSAVSWDMWDMKETEGENHRNRIQSRLGGPDGIGAAMDGDAPCMGTVVPGAPTLARRAAGLGTRKLEAREGNDPANHATQPGH